MKTRLSIIVLALAVALMAASGASAKKQLVHSQQHAAKHSLVKVSKHSLVKANRHAYRGGW